MSRGETRNLLEMMKKTLISILLDEVKISFQAAKFIKLLNSNTALPVICKAVTTVETTHLQHSLL